MIEFKVIGTPAPQGSKRFLGVKAGRGIMVESSKAVRPWREAVKWAAVETIRINPADPAFDVGVPERTRGLSGPVEVELVFTLPKPKSAPKRLKTWPDRKPDLSKLVRSTEDALTDAGVWEDDARVVRCLSRKVYPGEDQDALNVPGAVIRIREVKF